jgi:predicted dehydrogenase
VTLAFAGAGTMSAIHAVAAAGAGFPVVAVASRTPERSQERAAQLAAAATTYEQLPAGADAVIVATPPAAHVPLALAALDAGATALVETPLATTLGAADELVAREATAGRVLYGENLAHAPVVVRAVALARSMGVLGYVEVRAFSPRPSLGGAGQAAWGGGALFDLGAHAVAVALLLAGDDEPVEVTALLTATIDPAVDDHAEVRLVFASGLEARVEAAWRGQDTLWDLQASSDTGVVRADLLPTVTLEHDGEPVDLASPPLPEGLDPKLDELGYLAQIRALGRLARTGPRPDGGPGAAFGRTVLDVVCGAYASAGSGGPVALPFAGRRDRTPLELWRS